MNQYGKAAIRATELYRNGLRKSLQDAWNQSTEELFGCEKKICHRCTFLGLCEEGMIKGTKR